MFTITTSLIFKFMNPFCIKLKTSWLGIHHNPWGRKKTIIVMTICRHSSLQIPLYPHQKWMVITKPARGEMRMLEREDFVMFGFFTGLGRSTSAYLASRGVRDMEESLSRLLKSVVLVKCIQLFLHALCEPIKERWICLVSILVGVAYIFFHRITEVFPANLLMVIKRAKYMDWKKKQATLLQGGFEVFLFKLSM